MLVLTYASHINKEDFLPVFWTLHDGVQNDSGPHSASYPMGVRGSFPGGKGAAALSSPLTST
jgi:hypothetical protein